MLISLSIVGAVGRDGVEIIAPLAVSLSDQERNRRERHSGQNADHEPIHNLWPTPEEARGRYFFGLPAVSSTNDGAPTPCVALEIAHATSIAAIRTRTRDERIQRSNGTGREDGR
jgi:hypothetical protein